MLSKLRYFYQTLVLNLVLVHLISQLQSWKNGGFRIIMVAWKLLSKRVCIWMLSVAGLMKDKSTSLSYSLMRHVQKMNRILTILHLIRIYGRLGGLGTNLLKPSCKLFMLFLHLHELYDFWGYHLLVVKIWMRLVFNDLGSAKCIIEIAGKGSSFWSQILSWLWHWICGCSCWVLRISSLSTLRLL